MSSNPSKNLLRQHLNTCLLRYSNSWRKDILNKPMWELKISQKFHILSICGVWEAFWSKYCQVSHCGWVWSHVSKVWMDAQSSTTDCLVWRGEITQKSWKSRLKYLDMGFNVWFKFWRKVSIWQAKPGCKISISMGWWCRYYRCRRMRESIRLS